MSLTWNPNCKFSEKTFLGKQKCLNKWTMLAIRFGSEYGVLTFWPFYYLPLSFLADYTKNIKFLILQFKEQVSNSTELFIQTACSYYTWRDLPIQSYAVRNTTMVSLFCSFWKCTLIKVFNSLKRNKRLGSDELYVNIFTSEYEFIKKPLLKRSNEPLDLGIFPEIWEKDTIPLKFPSLAISYKEMKRISSIKILGVLINEGLTWKEHIAVTENKISKSLGNFIESKKY